MKVSEIFYSIQGEGVNVGKPMIFVRLARCNLSCSWCDTQYAKIGDELSTRQVIDRIRKYSCNHICWTGGEPVLQISEIAEVIDSLPTFTHEIETNGTDYINNKDRFKLITISPKKQAIKLEVLKDFALHKKCYFKFVVEDRKNFNFWLDIIETVKIDRSRVILMPEGINNVDLRNKAKWLVELCKQYNYRFSPRLQVWLYGKRRGV